MINFYCPKCGFEDEVDYVPINIIYPACEYQIVCPECKTIWNIKIDYHTLEELERRR